MTIGDSMNKQERDKYLVDTWARLDDGRLIEPDEIRDLLVIAEELEAENDLLIEWIAGVPVLEIDRLENGILQLGDRVSIRKWIDGATARQNGVRHAERI
jgi:hypothetical protein